ncbi:MAG: lipocalin-like domain-containing protein [Thermoanaerobaculia bacterium]
MPVPERLRFPLLALVVAVAALATLAVVLERRARRPAPIAAEVDVAAALGGDNPEGGQADPRFARAVAPRPFNFPADHGAHDGFRTEWWYLTGNLFAADGRAFGVQLTFFRNALTAAESASPSRWRSNHVWMAHFALSDQQRGTFRFAERFAREAVGLAGVSAAPFRVALEDWSIAATSPSANEFSPLHLAAREADFAVDLALEAGKPPVLQGDRGLSQKGPEPGNASYYYSLPRLAARGTVTVDGRNVPVTGEAWLDREWSTSALGSELAGWDWFALQLEDGRDLMFYRLRRKDGASDPWSRGSLVAADGTSRPLAPGDVELAVLSSWMSPSGATYPATWRLRIPSEALDLELIPRVANQELAVTVRYWEGAMRVSGTSHGRPIGGHGFVEMTGYTAAPEP